MKNQFVDSAHVIPMKYVLISPACNEEAFITKTLDSMIAQTHLPERWVIVDDGSTDRTAEIVQTYATRFPWIELVRHTKPKHRTFAAKVHAFNAGLERVRSLEFDVIGNLDADISFGPDYLEFLTKKFSEDPKLGVAGTPFVEGDGYDSARDSFEGENHVAGGCQLFRRQCFEDIGGYIANPAGGIDWIAVTTARMKGWKTRSFPERRFHHYRTLGTAERSNWAASFSYGEKDYYLGGSPVWQLFRVAYRSTKRPMEGVALLCGYCSAAARRIKRPVSDELMRFYRGEQMRKLKAILSSLLRLRKVDSFRLGTEQKPASAYGSRANYMVLRLKRYATNQGDKVKFRLQTLLSDKEKFECPVCGYNGPFMDLSPSTGLRKHAKCPKCGALERHRLQYCAINHVLRHRDPSNMRMLHFAPDAFLRSLLPNRFGQYETADLDMKDVDYNVDLQNLDLPDASYDFVLASHVLDYIPDDKKAIAEIRRILRPGGVALLPVSVAGEKTIEYARPNPNEFYHVRACGMDYFERYEEVFSKVEKISSDSLPAKYQLFIYEDRTIWPNEKCPLRTPMPGERHTNVVPICYA